MSDRQHASQLWLVNQQMRRHFALQWGIFLFVCSIIGGWRRHDFDRYILYGARAEESCLRWIEAAFDVRQCQRSLAQSSGKEMKRYDLLCHNLFGCGGCGGCGSRLYIFSSKIIKETYFTDIFKIRVQKSDMNSILSLMIFVLYSKLGVIPHNKNALLAASQFICDIHYIINVSHITFYRIQHTLINGEHSSQGPSKVIN